MGRRASEHGLASRVIVVEQFEQFLRGGKDGFPLAAVERAEEKPFLHRPLVSSESELRSGAERLVWGE
jgi:hypothetical protein